MSLTLQNLRAIGSGVEPASLLPGQIAFNITDKVLYVGDGSSLKTNFDGTQVAGVPGEGWYSMPMDFASLGTYYVANPEYYGDTPTDQQVLTWSDALNRVIWTSGGGGGGGSQVYVTTNASVAVAPGATTSAKISAAIGVVSPDEGDTAIVTGLPDDVYEGLYFFTTEWVKGAAYAYPSASEVIYDNTAHPTLTPTVQGAINDLDTGLIATTAIANTANSTANSALSIASAALPKAGGTMTGTLVSRDVNVQSGYNLQFAGGVNGSQNGISDSVVLVSSSTAASSTALSTTYTLANAALARSGGTMSGLITFDAGQVFPISGIQIASVSQLGVVQVGTNINVSGSGVISVDTASTVIPGIVQLNDTTSSASVTQALTANQGLLLQQQIDNLTLASNVILGGSFDCTLQHVDSTTAAGATAGLVINSDLPAPSVAFNDIYVVVTIGGSYSPPGGGGPYLATQGDWFLCGETFTGSGIYVWQYLGVGARPAYATTASAGIVQLSDNTQTQNGVSATLAVTPASLQSKVSDSTSTTSSTVLASSTAVKSAYDLANAALPKAGGTMTGDVTFSGVGNGVVFNDSSTVEAISDSVSVTSSVSAASSTAVKSAYDLANTANTTANAALPKAGGTMTGAITFAAGQTFPVSGIQDATSAQKGIVQVGTNIQVASGTISVNSASTAVAGIVQLNNTVASTSTTQALTANQGYQLQQQINALSTSNNVTFAGTFDAATSAMVTVTVEGAAVGFAVGSGLPAASAAVAEYFVIVSVAGTTTPPGGSPTAANVGDWFLASASSWTYIAAGYLPPSASTTTPGIITLATDAEVQAGVNSTDAVVSSALQSKMSDSVAVTSSTTIASSTAVKSAYDLANAAVPTSCYTALGALAAGTGASTVGTLSVGSNGQFLAVNTACSSGLQWCTLSLACVPCSAFTGTGAILTGTGSGTFTALPVGTNGQVLVPNSSCTGGLEWITTGSLCLQGYTCAATPFNTAFGAGAGDSITSGVSNVAVGYCAGTSITTGGSNTVIGTCAGDALTSGAQNTAIGANALGANLVGTSNVAIGSSSLQAATCSQNVAVGNGSGCSVTIGTGHVYVGFLAGSTSTSAINNTAVGYSAMGVASAGCTTAIGYSALGSLSSGPGNTAVGYTAGNAITTGSSNVLLGFSAGTGITTQDGHVAIGYQTLVGTLDINNLNLVAIGTCALRAVTTGQNNLGIGFCAGALVTTGGCNIAIGARALDSVTSTANNIGIGFSALTNITTGSENLGIGTCAGVSVTSATDLTAIGYFAGCSQATSAGAVLIGNYAGRTGNATGVTAIGFCAGSSSTSPSCVTYIGYLSGRNVTGASNTYVGGLTGSSATNASSCGTLLGFCAGSALTTGNGNTLVGFQSGRFITTGGFNVALGTAALQTATTGANNVAVGCGALQGISITSGNTALGHRAGLNATGSNNVVVGCDAGNQLSTGSTNVFIGNTAGDAVTTGSSNTIIGDVAGSTALTGEAIIAAGATIKFQANSSGAWSPDGASYGTSGQLLSSTGTGSAPAWTSSLPQVTAPTASTDAGVQGQIASDATYFYMYTGGRWQRTAWDATVW